MVTREDIARIVEAHRQDWPSERIRSDPAGFISVCDRLLNLIREQEPNPAAWLTGAWADLLFGERPIDEGATALAENRQVFSRRH